MLTDTNRGGYSKEVTLAVAGVAVLMMFFFHIFADFGEPYSHSYYSLYIYKGVPVEQIIAPLGQMCVTIFAFNTGFVMFKLPSKYTSFASVFRRLSYFMLAYWEVCILFLIYGLLFNLRLPSLIDFIKNLFGFDVSVNQTYVNVAHAWYVRYYLVILLISPFLIRIVNRTNKYIDILILVLLLSQLYKIPISILSTIWPITTTFTGMIVCKYNLIKKVALLNNSRCSFVHILFDIFIILFVLICRHEFSGYNPWWRFDGFFVFFFIEALIDLFHYLHHYVIKTLRFIGSIGMFMWFLHSIYMVDVNTWNPVLYFPAYPLLILLLGVAMMVPPSLFCKKISDKIKLLIHI